MRYNTILIIIFINLILILIMLMLMLMLMFIIRIRIIMMIIMMMIIIIGVPEFLLDPAYDARKDVPKFDFKDPKRMLNVLRERMKGDTKLHASIAFVNKLWHALAIVMCMVHVLTILAMCFNWVTPFIIIPALVIIRTSLGAWGHYYVHAKKPNWGEALFDMNYVGTSLIAEDGHCLLHHPYTQSGGDVKRTFFNGMLSMHPWLRVGYTVHKFGTFISGLYIRGYEVNFLEYDIPLRSEFWAVHAYLTVEFLFCVYMGAWWLWFCQFFGSLWLNTFLVVSSHDFEEITPSRPESLPEEHRKDWAIFQLQNSFDFTMCGNRWIDVFLSAGLSPHRTHHILPFQHSGFANLVSEPVVKEVVKEFGLEWKKPRNWWTERLPLIFSHYMMSPAKNPRTNKFLNYGLGDARSWMTCISYMIGGFAGIGAV
jgi:hypothetical protein